MVEQPKLTTRPPYDPRPLTVTAVKGNCVTATDGEITRTRDKNQLKVLPDRPAHLQSPAHNSKTNKNRGMDEHAREVRGVKTTGTDSHRYNDVFPDAATTANEVQSSDQPVIEPTPVIELSLIHISEPTRPY